MNRPRMINCFIFMDKRKCIYKGHHGICTEVETLVTFHFQYWEITVTFKSFWQGADLFPWYCWEMLCSFDTGPDSVVYKCLYMSNIKLALFTCLYTVIINTSTHQLFMLLICNTECGVKFYSTPTLLMYFYRLYKDICSASSSSSVWSI